MRAPPSNVNAKPDIVVKAFAWFDKKSINRNTDEIKNPVARIIVVQVIFSWLTVPKQPHEAFLFLNKVALSAIAKTAKINIEAKVAYPLLMGKSRARAIAISVAGKINFNAEIVFLGKKSNPWIIFLV